MFPLTYIGPLRHHNRVIQLACTCASLTPAPRFQASSSLCPSPVNCITRNIKRHLPYSTFLSLHLSLYLSVYFLSHSISLLHSIFLSFFQYFPSSLSLYLFILLFTLLSFLLSLLVTLLSFLTFAFHALVFPSGNAYSSFFMFVIV